MMRERIAFALANVVVAALRFVWRIAATMMPHVEVTEGRYLCEHCAGVYDDEGNHTCVYTGFCLTCNKREPLDRDRCAGCGATGVMLRKQGW
jgi:hypothetical protein